MQANAIAKTPTPKLAKSGENEASRCNRGDRGPSRRDISTTTTLSLQPGAIVEITSGILRGNYARVVRLMGNSRLDPRALVSVRQVMLHVIGSAGNTFATLGCDQVRHASEGMVLRTADSEVRRADDEESSPERNRK